MIVLPPEVGEQLGLGKLFQVTPFTYELHRLDLDTTEGPMRLQVLKFIDTGGSRGFAFLPEALSAFTSSMVEASSGLIIPQPNGR